MYQLNDYLDSRQSKWYIEVEYRNKMVVQDIKPSNDLETKTIVQMDKAGKRDSGMILQDDYSGNNFAWSETETCLTHSPSSFSGGWRRGVKKREESRLRRVLLVAPSPTYKRENQVKAERHRG